MRTLVAVTLAALVLGACTQESESPGPLTDTPTNGATMEPTVSGELGAKPSVTIPGGTPPTTLVVRDVVEGDGAEATAGSTVVVQYVGLNWSNELEFDASWDRGQPFSFPLGQGRVIAGWDQGVAGMKVGGRRLLVIPPSLGYGAAGAGGDIPPNETLVFVVDLVAVQ